MTRTHKIFTILVVVLLGIVLFLRSQRDDAMLYRSETLGISFSYPRIWGDIQELKDAPGDSDAFPGTGFVTRILFEKGTGISIAGYTVDFSGYGAESYEEAKSVLETCSVGKASEVRTFKVFGSSSLGYCENHMLGGEMIYSRNRFGFVPESGGGSYLWQETFFPIDHDQYRGLFVRQIQQFPRLTANSSETEQKELLKKMIQGEYPKEIADNSVSYQQFISSIRKD